MDNNLIIQLAVCESGITLGWGGGKETVVHSFHVGSDIHLPHQSLWALGMCNATGPVCPLPMWPICMLPMWLLLVIGLNFIPPSKSFFYGCDLVLFYFKHFTEQYEVPLLANLTGFGWKKFWYWGLQWISGCQVSLVPARGFGGGGIPEGKRAPPCDDITEQ